jgi:hypothetical protein
VSGRCGIAVVLALGLALAAADVRAHERTVSYSSWTLAGDGAALTVRLSLRDASRIAAIPAAYLPRTLSLYAGDTRCTPEPASVHAVAAEHGWLAVGWRLRCPVAAGPLRIHGEVMLDVAPSHLHFIRIAGGAERVLSDGERDWVLDDGRATVGASLADWVGLGIAHIGTGWDHLVFLLALLLLAGSLGGAVRVVTGFTLGHSLTLGLAVAGVVTPARGAVEALIGLSVALVAVENVWLAGGRRDRVLPAAAVLLVLASAGVAVRGGAVPPLALCGLALFAACYFALLGGTRRPEALRWVVAALFGLVHGFGFAGVLAEMALPRDHLLPALFGFNLGVELGQLAAVAVAWPLLRAVERWGEEASAKLVDWGSAVVCGLGVLWFVGRAFG